MWKLYKSLMTGEVIGAFKTNEDGSFISVSLDNPEYLAWVAEGNEPLPAQEPASNKEYVATLP
jgi:hypothetical protein